MSHDHMYVGMDPDLRLDLDRSKEVPGLSLCRVPGSRANALKLLGDCSLGARCMQMRVSAPIGLCMDLWCVCVRG